MTSVDRDPGSTARAAARGLVAAMAMSGLRNLTTNAGLLEKPPPEAIMLRHGPTAGSGSSSTAAT